MRRFALFFLAVTALFASEHHGQVNFGGLPVPGRVMGVARDRRHADREGLAGGVIAADGHRGVVGIGRGAEGDRRKIRKKLAGACRQSTPVRGYIPMGRSGGRTGVTLWGRTWRWRAPVVRAIR